MRKTMKIHTTLPFFGHYYFRNRKSRIGSRTVIELTTTFGQSIKVYGKCRH